jgi:hypothetical protein
MDLLITMTKLKKNRENKFAASNGICDNLHLMPEKFRNCSHGLLLYSGTYERRLEHKLEFLPLYAAPTVGDNQLSLE